MKKERIKKFLKSYSLVYKIALFIYKLKYSSKFYLKFPERIIPDIKIYFRKLKGVVLSFLNLTLFI